MKPVMSTASLHPKQYPGEKGENQTLLPSVQSANYNLHSRYIYQKYVILNFMLSGLITGKKLYVDACV